ncbi:Hypothetical_protein [Hexamita inflata]|uniref:Hypothetical_protein n=1 Tax=Hexamita inflata TaxID=28002 RepID=A0AA86QLC9_9EUKA|nr:Hypothetical protein HINF_LOCUS45656 [Hexamita inflata]
MQICSSKLVDKQMTQYCLKAVSLSSLTESSQVVSSPAQEVFHSLYTEKTQDFKIDLIYSMKNLPSFALFGLTKSIEILDSNVSVKVPQPQSKSALVCFQCDVHSQTSEFAFLALAQLISGLVYCPYTIMVLNSSLMQFRLTGLHVGGLIFNANNIQVQISLCNISGYVSNRSFSGVLIATATNSSTIEVQGVIICVQFNDIIGDNQIGTGAEGVQISGNLIQSCDLCGSYYFTYGLCLDYLNFGEVVNTIIICLRSFVFDGEGCSCPDGFEIQGSSCVNVLEIIESQDNQIKSLENTSSLMQDQIQKLQNSLNNLTLYLECVTKKGYLFVNGSCNKQEIDFMQCLTADKYISTFDISSITNQVGQTDFSNGNSVFRSQYSIQNAFINVQDTTYNSIAIPLFESQQQFNNIKIQIGTQSIETGSILTLKENITVNQMKIVSREQSTLTVTSNLNILITSSVSSTINNLQVNLAFEAQNGNITLIDHVTGTLNISGYQVQGVIQSMQIVAMIGINVEQAVLNLQNINYNPSVHNAGNLSSYLISNTSASVIIVVNISIVLGNISNYSLFGQLETSNSEYNQFGGIIAILNNSKLTVNSVIFDSYIQICMNLTYSGFFVGYSQSQESSLSLNRLCLQLTLTSQNYSVWYFGFVGSNEGNISLNLLKLSQYVTGVKVYDAFGLIGSQELTSMYAEAIQITIITSITMYETDNMTDGTISVVFAELNSQYALIQDINILNCSISMLSNNQIGILIGWVLHYDDPLQYNYQILNTIINSNITNTHSTAGYIYYCIFQNISIDYSILKCNQSGQIEFCGYIFEQNDCNTTISNSKFTNSTVFNAYKIAGFVRQLEDSNTTIIDSIFTNNSILGHSLNDFSGDIACFVLEQQQSRLILNNLLINQVNIEGNIGQIGGFVCQSTNSYSIISDSVMSNSNISGPSYIGAFYSIYDNSTLSVENSNITNVNLSGKNSGIYFAPSQSGSVSNCFSKNVSVNGILLEDAVV